LALDQNSKLLATGHSMKLLLLYTAVNLG